jgi:hypothetical protein
MCGRQRPVDSGLRGRAGCFPGGSRWAPGPLRREAAVQAVCGPPGALQGGPVAPAPRGGRGASRPVTEDSTGCCGSHGVGAGGWRGGGHVVQAPPHPRRRGAMVRPQVVPAVGPVLGGVAGGHRHVPLALPGVQEPTPVARPRPAVGGVVSQRPARRPRPWLSDLTDPRVGAFRHTAHGSARGIGCRSPGHWLTACPGAPVRGESRMRREDMTPAPCDGDHGPEAPCQRAKTTREQGHPCLAPPTSA